MVLDEYIKQYLLENGYSNEEIESESFNIDSLRDDFSVPMDLSKVSNFDDLKIFLAVNVDFIVTQEDIDTGKVDEIYKTLVNFGLIAAEKGLKLRELYIPKNSMRYYIESKHVSKSKDPKVKLKGFDLKEVELIEVDNNAEGLIILGNGIKANFYFKEKYYSSSVSVQLEDCLNIDLGKLDKIPFLSIRSRNCDGLVCSSNINLIELILDENEKCDMENVVVRDLVVLNFTELNFADLPSNVSSLEAENIGRLIIKNDIKMSRARFSMVNFEGNGTITCDWWLYLNACVVEDSNKRFLAQKIDVENCDFSVVLSSSPELELNVNNCSNFTNINCEETFLELSKGVYINAKNISGYETRRIAKILDLNADENVELLKDTEKLKEILINNNYLESIIVAPNLTLEQKDVLRDHAPDKRYDFGTDMQCSIYGDFSQKLGESLGFSNNFEMFNDADKLYDEIVKGIVSSWSDLEKFKYLYNELGKKISYDINVLSEYNSDFESFNYANTVARNVFSEILSKNGVCTGYAEAYEYLCRKAGLSCKTIGGTGYPNTEYSEGHSWNLIEYEEDGTPYCSFCDLTWDALRIKANMECEYFGFGIEDEDHELAIDEIEKVPNDKNIKKLTREKIEEIDKKNGHLGYKTDGYKTLLKDDERKIYSLLQAMMIVQDLSILSYDEVSDLAKKVLNFNGFEKSDVGINDIFIRKETMPDKEQRCILWVKEQSCQGKEVYRYFTFNSEQQQFKPLNFETIEELLVLGMVEFYEGERLPGFEDWISEEEYHSSRKQESRIDR